MKKIIIGIIVIIMVILTIVKFVDKGKDTYINPIKSVTVDIAQEVKFSTENVFGAIVKGINEAMLASQVSGNIKKIYVKEGDSVRQGQLLAIIEVPEMATRYKQAKVNVKIFEEQEKRARRNWDDYKPEERKQFKLQTEQARFGQEEAGAILKKTHIVAPFDGIVAKKFVKLGSTVMIGTPIINIVSDLKEREIVINVPAKIGEDIQIGDVVQVKNAQGLARATVREINPVSDLQTRKITIYATLDPSEFLELGDFVDVTIINNNQTLETSILQNAIVRFYDDSFVFVVEDEVAKMHKIVVLQANGEKAIVSGIKKGAMVIVSGAHDIGDGEKVNIIEN